MVQPRKSGSSHRAYILLRTSKYIDSVGKFWLDSSELAETPYCFTSFNRNFCRWLPIDSLVVESVITL